MPHDPTCIFCKIVSEELPAAVVYENESVVAFLDINPLADGHLLVIPREHYALITDMPADTSTQLFAPVPMLGRALVAVTGAQGFNVLVNQGEMAGQVVPHVHCHLIPRGPGDGLGYRWNAGTYAEGKAPELAAAFQKALSERG